MKKKISLILNLLIIIFELIGFIKTYTFNNRIPIEFYTEDSNLLALFTSIIYIIYLLKDNNIPKWLSEIKYISTICLTVTFVVVLFILTPIYNFNFIGMFFENSLLYHHLLCPILSIITFIYFDKLRIFSLKDNFIGISFTIIYGILLIILNILDIIVGPYPFLMVKNQSILMSILWFIIILGLTYFISSLLRKLYTKNSERKII